MDISDTDIPAGDESYDIGCREIFVNLERRSVAAVVGPLPAYADIDTVLAVNKASPKK